MLFQCVEIYLYVYTCVYICVMQYVCVSVCDCVYDSVCICEEILIFMNHKRNVTRIIYRNRFQFQADIS